MDPRQPFVSVLLPVYNAERYIAPAVESILAQTFTDFEFLILDDGSTDGSFEILQHYAAADPRIRLRSRPNAGLVVTLNEMLADARGEYIARMDADDVSLPQRFERQIEFLKQHPDVICAGTWTEVIDEAGRRIGVAKLPLTHAEIDQRQITGHTSICHPTAMFRREALSRLDTPGYKEPLNGAEDLDLWLRMAEIGQLQNIPEPLVQYRHHEQSVTESKTEMLQAAARAACEQCWERRNIQGVYLSDGPVRDTSNARSRSKLAMSYGWNAFRHGHRSTARFYGWKAVYYAPWHRDAWKLLLCSYLKKAVQPRTAVEA